MKTQEKELYKSLCSFKSAHFDSGLLKAATPAVLGQLFFNRMHAVAYGTLKRQGLQGKVNREFRNSLKLAYDKNIEHNNSFFHCVQHVSEILSHCECKFAMLKGAYLCKCYPEGYRTSNDVDLLVHPDDVTKIGEELLKADFKQGYIRNDQFEPATRKEIIESKMMRGEIVPYIKEINYPGIKFLEVDINFSLDYKPGDQEILSEMLENTVINQMGDLGIRVLGREDFFIHLCCHLYKEATTLPWIEMKRDMTLYKYCDIYMLLNDCGHREVDILFERARQMKLDKICAFAVVYTSKLFDFQNAYAVLVAEEVLKEDPDFIHRIISPKENKIYIYWEKDIVKRFFADNRRLLLKEVNDIEKTKYDAQ